MGNEEEAGSAGTGFGRLDGLIKDTVQEEKYGEEVEAAGVAQRMAALIVCRYADTHQCAGVRCVDSRCAHDTAVAVDLLEMIGLPRVFDRPTVEEREQLPHNLPKVLPMDTRAPNDHLIPERSPGYGRRSW